MADSIPSPWILDYLISVAEQHGANLSSVPLKEKGAKAQLVKFLSFPPPGNDEPCAIWVDISDKKHIIQARLSGESIKLYMDDPTQGGKPITSRKSALVILKKVRPAFGRVRRRDSHGMTADSTLFLHVDEFVLRGSFGDAMWGSPVDITFDANIRDWVRGLREPGGGGNVLMLRKQEAAVIATERETLAKQKRPTAAESHIQTTIDAINVKVRVARKSGISKPRMSSSAENVSVVSQTVDKEAVRRATWKRFHAKMIKYLRPPDEVLEQLLAMCGEKVSASALHADSTTSKSYLRSSSGSFDRSLQFPRAIPSAGPPPLAQQYNISRVGTPQSSPPRSPSHWSPSIRGSPGRGYMSSSESSETGEELEDSAAMDIDRSVRDMSAKQGFPISQSRSSNPSPGLHEGEQPVELSSPSLTMPPPAQPRLQPPPSSIPYASSPLSQLVRSIGLSEPSQTFATTEYDVTDNTLPPSSFPIPSSSLRLPPSASSPSRHPDYTPAWDTSVPVLRRVPPPQVVALRPDPNASGDGRVLVENSDAASPGSQRVAASQSQSQNRSQSQSLGGSQDQNESQGWTQSRDDAMQSQEQGGSQSQRPSKLRNEVELAPSQPGEGVLRNEQSVADAQVGKPLEQEQEQEQGSQESRKSRQSLSYKTDSQKSRQSLSYEEDSQSQGKASQALPTLPEEGQVTGSVQDKHATQSSCAHTTVSIPEDGTKDPSVSDKVQQRELSPMVVDKASPSAGDAPISGSIPMWAAIKTTPSQDDDEQDSQTEVDELLSDPPRIEQDDVVRTKAKSMVKTHPIKVVKDQLDLDDQRTAAMVDRYALEARKRAQVVAASTLNTNTERKPSTSRSRLAASPGLDTHKERPNKRRRKDGNGDAPSLPEGPDVFMSEDSFNEVPRKPSAPELSPGKQREGVPVTPSEGSGVPSAHYQRISNHDASAWAVPTFMLKKAGSQQSRPTAKMEAGKAVQDVPNSQKTIPTKRAVSKSSSPEQTEPPTKKRKTSITAVPGPTLATSARPQPFQKPAEKIQQVEDVHSLPKPAPADVQALPKVKELRPSPGMGRDQVYGNTALKVPSGTPARPRSSLPVAPPSQTGSDSRDARFIDLRAVSCSSSRSLPRAGSQGSTHAQHARSPTRGPFSANGKEKVPVLSVQKEDKALVRSSPAPARQTPILPVLSGARSVLSRSSGQRPSTTETVSRQSSAHSGALVASGSGLGSKASESSVSSAGASAAAGLGERRASASEVEMQDARPLLGGFTVSTEMTRTPGGPPLLGWNDLLEILLETGRARRETNQASDADPSAERR